MAWECGSQFYPNFDPGSPICSPGDAQFIFEVSVESLVPFGLAAMACISK